MGRRDEGRCCGNELICRHSPRCIRREKFLFVLCVVLYKEAAEQGYETPTPTNLAPGWCVRCKDAQCLSCGHCYPHRLLYDRQPLPMSGKAETPAMRNGKVNNGSTGAAPMLLVGQLSLHEPRTRITPSPRTNSISLFRLMICEVGR